MRVIKPSTVRSYWQRFPDAENSLRLWLGVAESSRWRNLVDVRRHFPHADAVSVKSDRTVTVFNIAGNKYRLITAIHYNTGLVFAMRFLTHSDYSKGQWKERL